MQHCWCFQAADHNLAVRFDGEEPQQCTDCIPSHGDHLIERKATPHGAWPALLCRWAMGVHQHRHLHPTACRVSQHSTASHLPPIHPPWC